MATMDARTLLRGYNQARDRFGAARPGPDREAALFALFEALNWAAALDDRLKDASGKGWRAKVPDGDALAGFRLARNRVHHQWAEAFRADGRSSGGLGAMALGRARLGAGWTWNWLPIADLPPPDPKYPDGAAPVRSYTNRLAERDVAETLDTLARVFAAAVR